MKSNVKSLNAPWLAVSVVSVEQLDREEREDKNIETRVRYWNYEDVGFYAYPSTDCVGMAFNEAAPTNEIASVSPYEAYRQRNLVPVDKRLLPFVFGIQNGFPVFDKLPSVEELAEQVAASKQQSSFASMNLPKFNNEKSSTVDKRLITKFTDAFSDNVPT